MHKTNEKLLCQYKKSMFKNEIIKESSAYHIPLRIVLYITDYTRRKNNLII